MLFDVEFITDRGQVFDHKNEIQAKHRNTYTIRRQIHCSLWPSTSFCQKCISTVCGQPQTLVSYCLNQQYTWPRSVMNSTSNNIQESTMVLTKVIWPYGVPEWSYLIGSVGFWLVENFASIRAFFIPETFLRHLKEPKIAVTLVTLKFSKRNFLEPFSIVLNHLRKKFNT